MNSKNDSTPSAGVSRPLYSQVLASSPPIRRVDVPRVDPQATNTRQQSTPVAPRRSAVVCMNPTIRMVTPRAPAVVSSSVPVSTPLCHVPQSCQQHLRHYHHRRTLHLFMYVINVDVLTRHRKSHDSEEYVCPKCPKTFVRKDMLTRHMATHTKSVKRSQSPTPRPAPTPKRQRPVKVSDVFFSRGDGDVVAHFLEAIIAEKDAIAAKLDHVVPMRLTAADWVKIRSATHCGQCKKELGSVGYSEEEENRHILYLDANNLCGWAMSQPLPVSDFEWVEPDSVTEEDIGEWEDDNDKGLILEVDLD
ncbi:hypothetical protein JTE90_000537 [Oedothorax gibbosus]|uniref:C2H2-type domain-containing protein n=1 Tax=Oedothorax gibbosus TaxID=931172 RepID=A0AAV6VV71_9ARAC|nr:hypothetical protein JTE90_000537 [Oedothorax gibbosus]